LHSAFGPVTTQAPSWRKAPAFGRLTPRRRPVRGRRRVVAGL